jgi:hypothetical protein
METFYAEGQAYCELISQDTNELIGVQIIQRPFFTIKANTIQEATSANIENWEFYQSNGGWEEFFDNIDPNTKYYENLVIEEIYKNTIEN